MSYRVQLPLKFWRDPVKKFKKAPYKKKSRVQTKTSNYTQKKFKILEKYKRKRWIRMVHGRPWRFFLVRRFTRRPWPFLGKRRYYGKRRRRRRRFTFKERPFLLLFLLNAPWRRTKYRLKWTNARLSSHSQAFCMYYGLKEKPALRIVRDIKRQPSRVRLLFEKFERRLDVMLVRLGWSPSFKSARELVSSGSIGVSKWFRDNTNVIHNETYCLSSGDRLKALQGQSVYNYIFRRFKWTVWRIQSRCLLPLPKHPRRFHPVLFRKYTRGKRRFAWLRYVRFFFYHPPYVAINYNSLVAIYRPGGHLRHKTFSYPMIFGANLGFWKDMIRAC